MTFGYRDYVTVADKRANAEREVARRRKTGEKLDPVVLEKRALATSFWGKAWCDNLESYKDFEYRLNRGRSYVRNGAVIDLQIVGGVITGLVSGSEVYKVKIVIGPVAPKEWQAIRRDCVGSVASMIELLQGKLSQPVMERICRHDHGLFPRPKEIVFKCDCYDWADMCKHVAAVMYGVGHRLDCDPALIFALRKVSPDDLIAALDAGPAAAVPAPTRVLATDDIAALFGLDMAAPAEPVARPKRAIAKQVPKQASVKTVKPGRTKLRPVNSKTL